MRIKNIAIVAGEHSGDSYGAMIIAKLKLVYPNANYIGIGGPKMQEAGLKSIVPMEKLSIIGVFNIVKKLPELIQIKNRLIERLLSKDNIIDLYIGIDAQEFNISVEQKIKKIALKNNYKIKIVQYISPTVWAWRPKRIFKVAKATNLVLCIFPFEVPIYAEHNIPACFVGHPLVDKLQDLKQQSVKTSIFPVGHGALGKTIIGLFPGSRSSEIKSLAKVFIETAIWLLQQNKDFYFIVPLVSNKIAKEWQEIYNNTANSSFLNNNILIINLENNNNSTSGLTSGLTSIDVMRSSNFILCASGTTTLEAFLLGIPMVVAYKVSKLNELLFRLLIKVKYIAMPNILSDRLYGKAVVPEFLQSEVTVDNLGRAVLELEHGDCSKWQDIYNYLKAGNVDHEEAVVQAIVNLLGDKTNA